MAKPNIAQYKTFDDITGRLDQIVDAVRHKETSLERSLDLFDEAIALGSKAVDMVDTTDFTPEEEAHLREKESAKAEAEKGDAPSASDGSDDEGADEAPVASQGGEEA